MLFLINIVFHYFYLLAPHLHDFVIYTTLTMPTPSLDDPGTRICTRYHGVAPGGLLPRIPCDWGVTGQFVIVQILGDDECLTLCEVGIYGKHISDSTCSLHVV